MFEYFVSEGSKADFSVRPSPTYLINSEAIKESHLCNSDGTEPQEYATRSARVHLILQQRSTHSGNAIQQSVNFCTSASKKERFRVS